MSPRMKTIKIISHMARVSKLWLNVDFSSGHLRTNIAARLPIIPRLPMEGIRISSLDFQPYNGYTAMVHSPTQHVHEEKDISKENIRTRSIFSGSRERLAAESACPVV